jgi:hypothetical protein
MGYNLTCSSGSATARFPSLFLRLMSRFLGEAIALGEQGIGMEQQKCRTQEQQELFVHKNLET